jgi:hypothetical protein
MERLHNLRFRMARRRLLATNCNSRSFFATHHCLTFALFTFGDMPSGKAEYYCARLSIFPIYQQAFRFMTSAAVPRHAARLFG